VGRYFTYTQPKGNVIGKKGVRPKRREIGGVVDRNLQSETSMKEGNTGGKRRLAYPFEEGWGKP